MGNDLLEATLTCKFGLKWMNKRVQDFVPPAKLLEFDSSMYEN